MDEKELLFYDIEVYSKYDTFVVFKNINNETLAIYHNDFTGLEDFIKGKTLVGYNNHFYDDYILSWMIDNKPIRHIKALNDRIISGEKIGWNPKFDSLDCFQQVDVSRPGLKKIEGNMGLMILESSVPFDIGRKLTDQELAETMEYCKYDVEATIEVYKRRVDSYFKPKEYLVSMLPGEKRKKADKWNTTTISANLLLNKPLQKWHNIQVPEWMMDMVPESISDMWIYQEKGSRKVNEFDCKIEFGFGGLHGAHEHKQRVENVKLLDVASMYPNIIKNLNALGASTEIYNNLIDRRSEVKHTDKVQSDALKLILNSVYGNLKNKYSLLYNPKISTTVCAYGQIALYELCNRLSATCEIININTDGVAFVPYSGDYSRLRAQWEKDFNLTLEQDEFDVFIQRDVNNYVAKKGDKIDVKGGDVNRYHGDSVFRNNNARILDIALVDYLLFGEDIINTLMDNLDKPHLYQYILQAGSTYQGTFDNNHQKYDKVNRIFASKEEGLTLYKKRSDDGLVRFPDAPLNMFLWNDDCRKLQGFENIVNINHYYQIIIKRLQSWGVTHVH